MTTGKLILKLICRYKDYHLSGHCLGDIHYFCSRWFLERCATIAAPVCMRGSDVVVARPFKHPEPPNSDRRLDVDGSPVSGDVMLEGFILRQVFHSMRCILAHYALNLQGDFFFLSRLYGLEVSEYSFQLSNHVKSKSQFTLKPNCAGDMFEKNIIDWRFWTLLVSPP